MGLESLHHAPGSAASYVDRFGCLAADMAWNELAQLHQFWLGMINEIKDQLAHLDPPTGLDTFIELWICTDPRLSKRREDPFCSHAPPTTPLPRLNLCRCTQHESSWTFLNGNTSGEIICPGAALTTLAPPASHHRD